MLITIREGYRLVLKHGAYVITDARGCIARDVDIGRDYSRQPTDSWQIIGIAKRAHSRQLIPLFEAIGADLGQGWVHDLDHGTRRMWAMPKHRRVVKVERITDYRVEV